MDSIPPRARRRDLRCLAFLLISLFVFSPLLRADQIVLPPYFQHCMVLQRSAEDWTLTGWSDLEHGEVELGTQTKLWRKVEAGPRPGWIRWEAQMRTPEQSGPLTLRVRGGTRRLWKNLEVRASLELTNLVVGEVWIWYTVASNRAPQATLSPEHLGSLARSCRILSLPTLAAMLQFEPPSHPRWLPGTQQNLPAVIAYFCARRLEATQGVSVGIVYVPYSELDAGILGDLKARASQLVHRPNDAITRALAAANQAYQMELRNARVRHLQHVNELKLQGVVTNAVLVRAEDSLPTTHVLERIPPILQGIRVGGVLW